jgi:nicotinamidase-related amidase
MGDALLPFPLTERSVNLCVDMQRIFSADAPWPAPWMESVLAVVATLAGQHPERTVSTRFIPPERSDEMPGMGQRYYTRCGQRPAKCLDLDLLEFMQSLAALCPPAMVIDKDALFQLRRAKAPHASAREGSRRSDYLGT